MVLVRFDRKKSRLRFQWMELSRLSIIFHVTMFTIAGLTIYYYSHLIQEVHIREAKENGYLIKMRALRESGGGAEVHRQSTNIREAKENNHPMEMETPSESNGGAIPPIEKRTILSIAPNYDGTWNDLSVQKEFEQTLEKLKQATVIHEPFDHISVPDLFSKEFYKALMDELPPPSAYAKERYAGTGPMYDALHLARNLGMEEDKGHDKLVIPDACLKKDEKRCWVETVNLHDYNAVEGRVLTVEDDTSSHPLWTQVIRLVHSKNFTGLLYDKFATDTGISSYKRKEIERQAEGEDIASTLRNSAALRIEPTSYHLTPHIDLYQKIVSWQFFHPENLDLQHRKAGTRFYSLKPNYHNVLQIKDTSNPPWFDYSHFDEVKEQPVIPNYFFAFAPNNHSFHGASIDPEQMAGVDPFSRRTFLGFITTKSWGFHHFRSNDWASSDYFFKNDG